MNWEAQQEIDAAVQEAEYNRIGSLVRLLHLDARKSRHFIQRVTQEIENLRSMEMTAAVNDVDWEPSGEERLADAANRLVISPS